MAVLVCTPINSVRGSLFSAPSPALTVCRLFDSSCSDWCETAPHCGFDLRFSGNSDAERLFACLFATCVSFAAVLLHVQAHPTHTRESQSDELTLQVSPSSSQNKQLTRTRGPRATPKPKSAAPVGRAANQHLLPDMTAWET